MKPHYFDQPHADLDDMMLMVAKDQGHVPKTCLLNGIVAFDQVSLGNSPCWGCSGPRARCGGRPPGKPTPKAKKIWEGSTP